MNEPVLLPICRLMQKNDLKPPALERIIEQIDAFYALSKIWGGYESYYHQAWAIRRPLGKLKTYTYRDFPPEDSAIHARSHIKLHRDDNSEWSLVFWQSYSCHAMSRSDLFFQHIRFRSGFYRSCLYCMQSLMFPKVCFRPIGPASTITQDPALARLVQALGFSVKAVFVMGSGSVWNVLNEHILHVFGSQICLPYTRCFSHCLSLKLVRVL